MDSSIFFCLIISKRSLYLFLLERCVFSVGVNKSELERLYCKSSEDLRGYSSESSSVYSQLSSKAFISEIS